MLMLMHVDKVHAELGRGMSRACAGWAQDGQVFFIRDKDELDRRWLPLFFQRTKFTSFSRKLYRWGFRRCVLTRILRSSSR